MTEYRVRQHSGLAIIDLHGRLDAFAGDIWDRACARIGQDVKAILLNFERVDYMSSTGIALIIGLIVQATKVGRRLLACGLSDHYIKIFQVARLADYISVFPDEAAAIAGCRASQYQV